MLGRCLAGIGEHALVLRRTRSEAALLRMSALGWAVLRDSEYRFLGWGVGRTLGQTRRHVVCANHRSTAAGHLES